MGRRGGETPAQIFWHIGVKKKWYKLSKLGGGRGNLDKIQKNSYLFSGNRPLVLVQVNVINKTEVSYWKLNTKICAFSFPWALSVSGGFLDQLVTKTQI